MTRYTGCEKYLQVSLGMLMIMIMIRNPCSCVWYDHKILCYYCYHHRFNYIYHQLVQFFFCLLKNLNSLRHFKLLIFFILTQYTNVKMVFNIYIPTVVSAMHMRNTEILSPVIILAHMVYMNSHHDPNHNTDLSHI